MFDAVEADVLEGDVGSVVEAADEAGFALDLFDGRHAMIGVVKSGLLLSRMEHDGLFAAQTGEGAAFPVIGVGCGEDEHPFSGAVPFVGFRRGLKSACSTF